MRNGESEMMALSGGGVRESDFCSVLFCLSDTHLKNYYKI